MNKLTRFGWLFVATGFLFVLPACKKNQPTQKVARNLVKSMEATLGGKPIFRASLNFEKVRKSPLYAEYKKQMAARLKKNVVKGCNAQKFLEQMKALVVLGFDNMNLNYVAVNGTFDASKVASCMEKTAKSDLKKRKLYGKTIYGNRNVAAWVASKNSIVALVRNRRNPLGYVSKLKMKTVLKKLLAGKGALAEGNAVASKDTLSFRFDRLPSTKLPPQAKMMPLKVPNSVWGSLNVMKKTSLQLRVAMQKSEDATKAVGLLSMLSLSAPAAFKNSIKFEAKGKLLSASFEHNTKQLAGILMMLAKKTMSRRRNLMDKMPSRR